jgi:hypothetical protein
MFCASCLPQTFPSSYRSDRSEQLPLIECHLPLSGGADHIFVDGHTKSG